MLELCDDLEVYEAIKPLLNGGAIYHCGPVVAGLDTKDYRFVAAGPTTSIREEPYQADVMRHFNIKAVIGNIVILKFRIRGNQADGIAPINLTVEAFMGDLSHPVVLP